jgi:3-oxoacyl-[acyl-carrier-protein] synthase II
MLSVVAGHAAGAVGLGYAADLLHAAKAGAMVLVAADTVSDAVLEAYQELTFASPTEPPRLVESLAGMVLEPLSRARARGARVYGEVKGYGLASCPTDAGTGVARAMSAALDDAGWQPSEVSAVWSSASGWAAGDHAEADAIRGLLGPDVAISTPNHEMGDPLAASGPLLCSLALTRLADAARSGVLVNATSVGGSSVSIALAAAPRLAED